MDVLAIIRPHDSSYEDDKLGLAFTVGGDMLLTISGSNSWVQGEIIQTTITGCTDSEASNYYSYNKYCCTK